MNTQKAAEKMLETGEFYTALEIGREFGESAKRGSGWLYNIRMGSRYETVETELPNRRVKVVAIDGRRVSIDQLQNKALLFRRPRLLIENRV
ncbi:hypothetical protein EXT42_01645 [Pseudoalteromonas sp. CO302Y]|uniref:hypothetical protein n=1 Tax=unclassified Pseudoalteromonas TaxID=194690 RepID=UPI0010237F6A|nr:hypothetical protein EXT42_01645 [Pseudoalteromonas sp. CO302Y]RZG11100.1 hypothetical protein EXT40_01645 [Pseudoalteromonas sp. CO133X]